MLLQEPDPVREDALHPGGAQAAERFLLLFHHPQTFVFPCTKHPCGSLSEMPGTDDDDTALGEGIAGNPGYVIFLAPISWVHWKYKRPMSMTNDY